MRVLRALEVTMRDGNNFRFLAHSNPCYLL